MGLKRSLWTKVVLFYKNLCQIPKFILSCMMSSHDILYLFLNSENLKLFTKYNRLWTFNTKPIKFLYHLFYEDLSFSLCQNPSDLPHSRTLSLIIFSDTQSFTSIVCTWWMRIRITFVCVSSIFSDYDFQNSRKPQRVTHLPPALWCVCCSNSAACKRSNTTGWTRAQQFTQHTTHNMNERRCARTSVNTGYDK